MPGGVPVKRTRSPSPLEYVRYGRRPRPRSLAEDIHKRCRTRRHSCIPTLLEQNNTLEQVFRECSSVGTFNFAPENDHGKFGNLSQNLSTVNVFTNISTRKRQRESRRSRSRVPRSIMSYTVQPKILHELADSASTSTNFNLITTVSSNPEPSLAFTGLPDIINNTSKKPDSLKSMSCSSLNSNVSLNPDANPAMTPTLSMSTDSVFIPQEASTMPHTSEVSSNFESDYPSYYPSSQYTSNSTTGSDEDDLHIPTQGLYDWRLETTSMQSINYPNLSESAKVCHCLSTESLYVMRHNTSYSHMNNYEYEEWDSIEIDIEPMDANYETSSNMEFNHHPRYYHQCLRRRHSLSEGYVPKTLCRACNYRKSQVSYINKWLSSTMSDCREDRTAICSCCFDSFVPDSKVCKLDIMILHLIKAFEKLSLN